VASDDRVTAPAIILVASNLAPAALAFPPEAELGRFVRAGGMTYEIADEQMSQNHATVRWERGSWTIHDLDSRNGSYVNGERIHGEVKRRGDAVVRIGQSIFLLVVDGRGHPAVTAGDPVVGPELGRAYDRIRSHARSRGQLLLQGGAGIGKQLAAREFHAASGRSGPFHVVHCGTIHGVADRLVFGGKKGIAETIGHLQMARGGTLYLADLPALDQTAQASLVKLLTARSTETNLVCAGAELQLAVAEGRLREDLHQQLAAVEVTLPPLRMRRVDLVRLIELEAGAATLHPRLVESCVLRPWPGHVRELRTAIRHAASRAIAEDRDLIRPEDLLETAGLPPGSSSVETSVERKTGGHQVDLGPAALAEAMQRANGSLSVAARALSVHRTQLAKLLDEAGLPYEGLTHDD